MKNNDGLIRVGSTQDPSHALTLLQSWRKDAEELGFYPEVVGLVAGSDPGTWEIEVSERLFDLSLDRVW